VGRKGEKSTKQQQACKCFFHLEVLNDLTFGNLCFKRVDQEVLVAEIDS
jgi:hypothetical protein